MKPRVTSLESYKHPDGDVGISENNSDKVDTSCSTISWDQEVFLKM